MSFFGRFYLDREKDIVVELFREGDELRYILRTPNHHTGNLITNLSRLCSLPLSRDGQGLKIIEGQVPSYIDGDNRQLYVLRIGNTKIANIYPDGSIERKASIPAISKILMSQTKDYRLDVARTIVKTYILSDCKFRTDLHSHMNANLDPDILIALGIAHRIRYPLYYVKKLALDCSQAQWDALLRQRQATALRFRDSTLTGKYLERRIDDNTFINFADLLLGNLPAAQENIRRIRNSLTMPKDGQAVFANLEKLYLYRYVFTKGSPADAPYPLDGWEVLPDRDIRAALGQILRDREHPVFRDNTLFEDKLLWIARGYRDQGIRYVEISDTSLVKRGAAVDMLRQVHRVMPAVTAETGVLLRFLAGIRRTPLTIVRDRVTPNDYLAENLSVLRSIAPDPYVAGSDILGEEINDIQELRPVLRELVKLSGEIPGFVIRIHAGENDSLRDNVANSLRCVREALDPGQAMPRLRIGHGLYTPNLNSPKGKQLLQELREQGVVLEFQLTSNVRLNNLSDLDAHPLKQYLRAGVACVQGTDGCALYGTSSIDEQLALEKLLGLSHEELLQMRRVEAGIEEESLRVFREKSRHFALACPDGDLPAYCARREAAFPDFASELWLSGKLLDSRTALSDQIRELPQGMTPIVLLGGSFNNDRHRTQVRASGLEMIDRLLEKADPETQFFVIGHRLRAYERYLVEQNRDRFLIYSIVPTLLSPEQVARLRKSPLSIRISVESSGMGLYKSFAYEIFKRRESILIAFDGNSSGANLIQEAKNGRFLCRIWINSHCRALRQKAKTLQGYVKLFEPGAESARLILQESLMREQG